MLRKMLALALKRNGTRYRAAATPHITMLYDSHIIPEHAIELVCRNANRLVFILSHVGLARHQWIGQWELRR